MNDSDAGVRLYKPEFVGPPQKEDPTGFLWSVHIQTNSVEDKKGLPLHKRLCGEAIVVCERVVGDTVLFMEYPVTLPVSQCKIWQAEQLPHILRMMVRKLTNDT